MSEIYWGEGGGGLDYAETCILGYQYRDQLVAVH